MKRCSNCKDNTVYEANLILCPECQSVLEPIPGGRRAETPPDMPPAYQPSLPSSPEPEHTFETRRGRRVILNGAVAEISPRQYYPNRISKLVMAIFAGEPYQFGHTSIVTTLRVEEHTTTGLPARGRDVIIFGNLQSTLVPGDDVEVTASIRGGRHRGLVARRIYNHTTDSVARVQPHISAAFFRILLLVIALPLCMILGSISPGDLQNLFVGAIVWVGSYCIAPVIILYVGYRTLREVFRI